MNESVTKEDPPVNPDIESKALNLRCLILGYDWPFADVVLLKPSRHNVPENPLKFYLPFGFQHPLPVPMVAAGL